MPHEVLCYDLAFSNEELYNYLLCQEYNKVTGQYEAVTYRLSRLANLHLCKTHSEMKTEVKRHLEMMKKDLLK